MDFLTYPIPDGLKKDIYMGFLKKAEEQIQMILEHRLPPQMRQRLRFELFRIKLLRRTYKWNEKEAFSIFKKTFKGATKPEFEILTKQGKLDWMYIDGQRYYESRFDKNLAFNDRDYKAKQRVDKDVLKRRELINKAVERLLKYGEPKKYRVRARISLKHENPVEEKVRVWLPFPKEGYQQEDVKLINASHEHEIADNSVGQRTVYMEGKDSDTFSVEFEYTVSEWIGTRGIWKEKPTKEDTSEKPPHIVFTPFIKSLVESIFHDVDYKKLDDITIARKIYDFVTLNVNYSYVLPYAMYNNIPEYVGTMFKGDCGFQALLFITLCRAVGIPARWQSGWSITPIGASSHDWALVYLEKYGWVPVDLSFGGSRRDQEPMRIFYFTNLDGFRMFANTEFQGEFYPSKKSWRLDPYDNQTGEMEIIAKEEDGYVIDLESKIEVLKFEEL
ncbi:MAG: transglutaminase domain-containing protein [Fervidobacterium sp.]|uniref:Transglutaminase-like enzyme, putative cysteine protease n=1 Tax=Fervidobacterium gondwanense DSM 13020 TaxID=1121883 RepID=A0A1M7RY09_FERGO|nr:transglutaminase domain-containing protein [Fervidobacterium gondwanense]UXF00089.1 transglutaminase [Fervidobacterium riparium]SHN50952.1 Transglutaminase-like enzyme, putative cysteine protease [Fervidobacterium gondwanense DSM 13020]